MIMTLLHPQERLFDTKYPEAARLTKTVALASTVKPGIPAPDGAVPAADPQLQDLVTALLTGAIQTSYTLDRLRTLAQLHRGDDPIALAQINDAIDMLSTAKAALIQNADIAAALQPPP